MIAYLERVLKTLWAAWLLIVFYQEAGLLVVIDRLGPLVAFLNRMSLVRRVGPILIATTPWSIVAVGRVTERIRS